MMHTILEHISSFQKTLEGLGTLPSVQVSGLWDSSKAAWIAYLAEKKKVTTLVVTAGSLEAEHFYQDLSFFSSLPCNFFPPWETLPHENIAPHVEIVGDRFSVLENLLNFKNPHWVVTPIDAILHQVLHPMAFKKLILSLSLGFEIPFRKFLEFLEEGGYHREAVVENKGEYAVRGGMIDFYSPPSEFPLRLEFEGDTIFSLREFDPQTQLSLKEVKTTRLFPAWELELYSKKLLRGSFLDYFPKDFLLVFDDWDLIVEKVKSLEKDIPSGAIDSYLHLNEFKASQIVYLSDLSPSQSLEADQKFKISIERSQSWQGTRNFLSEDLINPDPSSDIFLRMREKTQAGFSLYLVSRKKTEEERLIEVIKDKGFWDPQYHHACIGSLSSGFVLPKEKIAILTDEEIFGRLRVRPPRSHLKRGVAIHEYSELKVGDWVVHLSFGIGKYLGVSSLDEKGLQGEFLTIEYDKKAKLYVPVDQIELVERYIGVKGGAVRLSRLGGKDWEKVKKKALLALKDYAAELLEIQAKRSAIQGYAFQPDTSWQKDFEAAFIYDETPDQEKAIEEVKRDLELARPMDRLICGDVGYGKTEVAIRAAFKAVMEGKQVAILVPTTILAQQHFYTFRERFAGYPIQVEMFSRFRTGKEQKGILQLLKEGQLDVIIGTHRLLGDDVSFKDLGLVIVDEEQRFGVSHKERFKKLKLSVDVLTLTATPIPRTLYLSLVQARDMSLIKTPPQDRLPVETLLTAYDETLIRDGIVRELARDGQVFFIHNRVGSIYRVQEKLKKLVPKAHFAVAHGQMPEDELEEVIRNFIEGKIQVLVSTNIVESGLDIPNANTIIIDHAEGFGLADLYQLRGRVGRYKRRAYAYLMYASGSILKEEAKMRLKTIEDFTELGSGFKVAMRDLEIRGAGNLLGKEQHGHITAVGFQLYCRLLDDAIRRLKGENISERMPVSLKLGFEVMIPLAYLSDPLLRMEIYRKIFEASSEKEFSQVTQELIDRFGPLPPEMELLLEVAQLKALARRQGLTSIQIHRDRVFLKAKEVIRRVEMCPKNLEPSQLLLLLRKVLKGGRGV